MIVFDRNSLQGYNDETKAIVDQHNLKCNYLVIYAFIVPVVLILDLIIVGKIYVLNQRYAQYRCKAIIWIM